jgi:hypothetical protein
LQSGSGKVCKACGEWKPLDGFNKSKNRDGRNNTCKPCQYEQGQALRKQKQARVGTDHIPAEKQCAKCGTVKPASQFSVYRAASDGLGRYCRECDNAVSRARRYKIPEDRVREMASAKHCEVCGLVFQDTKQQHFDHRHSDGAVRGVVCYLCNSLVGISLENAARLRAVARYLDRTVSTDYRYQPYSVTDLAETDIQKVDGEKPFTPEENFECPKNSQTAQTPQSNPRFPRLRA